MGSMVDEWVNAAVHASGRGLGVVTTLIFLLAGGVAEEEEDLFISPSCLIYIYPGYTWYTPQPGQAEFPMKVRHFQYVEYH